MYDERGGRKAINIVTEDGDGERPCRSASQSPCQGNTALHGIFS